MHIGRTWAIVSILVAGAHSLQAEDWNQWRGQNRNGVAAGSPQLADAWPKSGPRKVWQSEPVAGGGAAGCGSPAVSGNKIYIYSSAHLRVPLTTRTFTENKLRELGWFQEKPPQELLDKIEKARVLDERTPLKGNELNDWAKKWIENNLDQEQRKKFNSFAVDRLRRGTNAFDLAALDKLAEIKNRTFETKDLFDKWLADCGLPETLKKDVVNRVPTTEDRGQDIITCFNAADGKTVWKKEYPGKLHGNGASSTPCVSDGRVYVTGSASAFYCLDADKGEEIWKGETGKGEKILMNDSIVSCSPLIIDGLVIVPGGPLTALDSATGGVRWVQQKIAHTHCSPVAWEKGDRKYALCNTAKNVFCVDAQTGNIAWEAPGGGQSTAVVQGDTMLIFSGNNKVGLTAYKLSLEKAEKIWTIEGISDRGASPLVYNGSVYAVGSFGVVCAELDTGKEVWRAKPGTGEISSPVLADGKILAHAGGSSVVMFKADPSAFALLAKAELGMLGCSSPAFFDGKLLVRGNNAVHCYDLTAKEEPKPEKAAADAPKP